MTDDHGDWLHEVARDKVLDEAECELCVHYRVVSVPPIGQVPAIRGVACAMNRPLTPCREFLREIGSEG